MAITKVSRGLLSTGIVDNSNATAITIDSSEDVTLANNLILADGKHILLGPDSGDAFNTESPIRIQDSTNAYINIKAGTGHSGGLLIGDTDDDFMGGLLYNNNTNALTLYSNNGTRATIDSSGNFQISDGNLIVANGHGIDFSATSDAGGMSSELLDDYEEGTFTPVYDNVAQPTYQTQSGKYIKIGKIVHVTGTIICTGLDTSDGSAIIITGFPFNVDITNEAMNFNLGRITSQLNGEEVDLRNVRAVSTGAMLLRSSNSSLAYNSGINADGTLQFAATYHSA